MPGMVRPIFASVCKEWKPRTTRCVSIVTLFVEKDIGKATFGAPLMNYNLGSTEHGRRTVSQSAGEKVLSYGKMGQFDCVSIVLAVEPVPRRSGRGADKTSQNFENVISRVMKTIFRIKRYIIIWVYAGSLCNLINAQWPLRKRQPK
jgi:hypothetical protein